MTVAIESPHFRSRAEWDLFIQIAVRGAANDNGLRWPLRRKESP